jgi:hypothetical protein
MHPNKCANIAFKDLGQVRAKSPAPRKTAFLYSNAIFVQNRANLGKSNSMQVAQL